MGHSIENEYRTRAMPQNGGRALAPSVERFLGPALSFVTFLFAVEKKSKLPQSACEDEIISNEHKYRSTRGSKKSYVPNVTSNGTSEKKYTPQTLTHTPTHKIPPYELSR